MKKISILCLLVIALISCNKPGNKSDYSPGNESNAPALTKEYSLKSEQASESDKKLIKEGNIRFRTDDIDDTYRVVTGAVKKYKGYISNESTFNYSNQSGYDLNIRVPKDNFDALLAEILSRADVKELDNKSTNISDVTEEYIDIETRLKIKKESEQKLLDLLKQSNSIDDILKINEQLTTLRTDIESIEGRLKYLSSQVKYSTMSVSFYEKIKYSHRFAEDIAGGFKNGWQIFLHLLTLLSNLWLIILVTVLVIWGIRRYRNKRR